MKRFLRRMACVAAMLLLTVCPVKALAAGIALPPDVGASPDGQHVGEKSGTSIFGIQEVERWRYLEVTVLDEELHTGISGVTVKLYLGNSNVPVTDTAGAGFITGSDGKIEIRVARDDQQSYRLEVEQPGFYLYQSGLFNIDIKRVEKTLELKPKRFTVTYLVDPPGSIPTGVPSTESVRWGQTPTNPPKVETEDPYILSYWSQDGKRVDLGQLKVFDDIVLEANYARQYLVKYVAGDYGYLDGPAEERVTAGEKPKNVPTPVPDSREFWFVKWRIDRAFSYNEVDPASMDITGDITFKAVFDVRKHQPVIINTPPTEPGQPLPAPDASLVAPTGAAGGSHVPNQGASQALPTTGEAGETEVLASVQEETTTAEQGSGELEPHGGNPAVPAAGQADQDTRRGQYGLILLLGILTLVAGLLRLLVIHRTIRSYIPLDEEGEEHRTVDPKPLVTEAVIGLICVVLWGSFFARYTDPRALAALALWGAVLLMHTVLLIRAEYRLRHVGDKK